MKYAVELDSHGHDMRIMFHDDRYRLLSNITVITAAV
jgi:hypothetical protein